MIAWIILIVAGLLEIAWSGALKKADGLRRPGWSIVGVVLAMGSLLLLSHAVRDLPIGTAYAVWVGVGAAGTAVAGIIVFDDKASPARLGSLAAIIIGVIGLKLLDG